MELWKFCPGDLQLTESMKLEMNLIMAHLTLARYGGGSFQPPLERGIVW